jgi:uncharacterized membrane protein YbhN (UPF0104 family)
VTEPSSPRRAKVASTVIGGVVALLAGAFVVRAVLQNREEIRDALEDAVPGWLAVALVLGAVGMVAIALPWRRAIRLLGDDLPTGQVVARYFVGEIGKYVPGGIWPILGRGELAHRWGLTRTAAYGSVLLSLFALYLASTFVVVAGLPALVSGDDGSGPVAVLVLLPIGLMVLHPRVLAGILRLGERILRRPVELVLPGWGASVGLVLRYVPSWLAIGGATWAVARSLDPSADVLEVGTAAVLSWLVGFVLVPVPGGVGVREAAFVAAAGSLDPGIAAAVAVAARAIFVTVDAVGALLGSAALRQPPTAAAERARHASL